MTDNEKKRIDSEESSPSIRDPRLRPRSPKRNSNPIASLLSGKPIEITVKIPEEDKAALVSTVKEMADKMDFRWKRTQQLIVIGYVMTASSFIISKLI